MLTKEEIEGLRAFSNRIWLPGQTISESQRRFNALCDMALASLDHSTSIRPEAMPTDKPLQDDMDAQRWAQEFNKVFAELHEGCELDEDWLMGWFANAIMCGYDGARRRNATVNAPRVSEQSEQGPVAAPDERGTG